MFGYANQVWSNYSNPKFEEYKKISNKFEKSLNNFRDNLVAINIDNAKLGSVLRIKTLSQSINQLSTATKNGGTNKTVDSVLNYVPRWPLMVHAGAAMYCLLMSAVYHLF